ncbi:tetratricopeptide repeat protein [Methanobrevibacter sp.]|uniref:tetratricopeptide repeat protein n=1 Tax=Methanobrevibacter sp. TaxID=66852 RepID=UPI00261CA3AF|nr:tetratricopeptide repeat protein [uncultured Methanobrevibacter sp.]
MHVLIQKGLVLYGMKNYNNALGIFNKVLSIDCENQHALMDKGLVFLEIGRYVEALDLFNKCLIND